MPRGGTRTDGHTPACLIRWEPSGSVASLHCPGYHRLYVTPPPDASVGNQVGRLTSSFF